MKWKAVVDGPWQMECFDGRRCVQVFVTQGEQGMSHIYRI